MLHARKDYARIQDPADALTLARVALAVAARLNEVFTVANHEGPDIAQDELRRAENADIEAGVEMILREVLVGGELGGTPIAADEPVFLLRGQDRSAPGAVRAWAHHARRLGVANDVIEAALAQAHRMESWPIRKVADADPAHLAVDEADSDLCECCKRELRRGSVVTTLDDVRLCVECARCLDSEKENRE